MKRALGLVFVLALIAAPAAAQKVTIDFAHDYDFGSVKTFQYVDTTDSNIQGNQMMADRVATMIIKELREGGLVEVQENPDIFVTYHYTTEKRSSYTTTNYGYGGYHGGWYGWGGSMGSSTTQQQTYTDGTLIIDAYDATDKKMVWRGTGTVTVKAKPEKQIKQVENILDKLGNKWDKILAGKGK
ncbi:MAG: DUF4136 domain-containing protein [Acidobacteria bacterium]|jgi:hypothetical protein|nr:DUF4136 domain-containing protein [Acidobacteriota bacterium]